MPSAALRAEALGAHLPPLVVEAERVASTVMQGVHGRRRSGMGDSFWQFRPYLAGDAASRVDWRQSAKAERLYVRETEWEAAQTVVLWRDGGPRMQWRSHLAEVTKKDRASLLLLALAALLLRGGERIVRDNVTPPAPWRDLLAGRRSVAAADGETTTPAAGSLVFPGSFDPLHEGHRLMARIAEEIAERPLSWEISVTHVEKPLLDYLSIRDRAAQFAGQRLWLTRAARFTEKLAIFPEGTFVVGADTFVRLADPRYYGGSTAAAEEAVEAIAERARGLIVFGRTRNGVFEDASQIDAPQRLRDVSYFVSQREFRLDISSTELRRQENERRETACEA